MRDSPHVGLNAISLMSPLTGVGQYTLQLAKALDRAGARLSYFYGPVWSEKLLDNEAKVGAERDAELRQQVVVVRKAYSALKLLVKAVVPRAYDVVGFLQQHRFSRGLRSRAIDVYHDPNFIPFRFNGPTVITIHDLSILTLPHMHPADRVKAIGRRLQWAADHAEAIITVSHFVRDEVIDILGAPPEKVFAIHNGVGPEFHPRTSTQTSEALDPLGVTHGQYVLGVGTLEPRKNLGRLCRAYRSLPRELRERYPLVLAGMRGWGDSEFSRDLDALQREGNLVLPGYLDAKVLYDLYAGASLFVYPSVYEGFGLPVAEAMASGTPVVTSNCSSLPEVAGDAARLVDPVNTDELAEAMRDLLENPAERERMSAKGIDRAAGFSWDATARQTLGVYAFARSIKEKTPG